jgi:hypothetical protein
MLLSLGMVVAGLGLVAACSRRPSPAFGGLLRRDPQA